MRPPRLATIALSVLAALSALAAEPAEPDPRAVLASMGDAADRVRDYTMTLVRQERMGDALQPERTSIEKWARPYRLYLKDIAGPDAGQEVLYARGWNRDRLRAHRGRFPDLTVNLDPRGYFAMAHAHHPVTDVSLPGFVKTLLDNVSEAERRGEGSVRFAGRETLWGRPAQKIEMACPRAGEVRIVKRGETLWDLAEETGQAMYVILHANRDKGWRGPRDPDPGDRVFVPRYYAGRVLLWVDERLRLPIRAEIFDHDGNPYERYEHRDLEVNVGLTDADFDPANPGYDF
jgi:nucleoid-associated protein YgaU